jgi:hypothetical protein
MSERINIRLPDELAKDCKEYAKGQGITLTDMIISGLQDQLRPIEKPGIEPANTITAPMKSVVEASGEVKTPAITPDIPKVMPNGYIPKSAAELRAAYKSSHPMDICPACHQFNNACVCGATIYEPDDIQPARKRKTSVSKAMQPLVNAMLSSVKRSPTVQHHAMCTCGMCKPAKAA